MTTDDLFKRWNSLTQEDQKRFIEDLEAKPDRILDTMRAILKSAWKSRWIFAVQTIRAIGYPHNIAAIPELIIDQVGDMNSEGRKEAIQTLLEMPPEVIVEYIVSILWDRGRTISYWASVVEGICYMLGEVRGEYALQCYPIAIYLLANDNLPGDFDKSSILDMLEAALPDNINYALPELLDLAAKNSKDTIVGKQVRSLIDRFDRDKLIPYRKVLNSIE